MLFRFASVSDKNYVWINRPWFVKVLNFVLTPWIPYFLTLILYLLVVLISGFVFLVCLGNFGHMRLLLISLVMLAMLFELTITPCLDKKVGLPESVLILILLKLVLGLSPFPPPIVTYLSPSFMRFSMKVSLWKPFPYHQPLPLCPFSSQD